MIEWNKITWYSKLGALVLFLGLIPALCFYIGTQYELAQQTLPTQSVMASNVKSQTIAPSTYSFIASDDQKSFEIKEEANVVARVNVDSLPKFDPQATTPTDYYLRHQTNGQYATLNSAKNTFYFAVDDQANSGNDNQDHAIYSYNFLANKSSVIAVENGHGFNHISISPKDTYLITDEGFSAGGCAGGNFDLIVYDPNKHIQIGSTPDPNNPSEQSYVSDFVSWVNENQFNYQTRIYTQPPSDSNCGYDAIHSTISNTYTIK